MLVAVARIMIPWFHRFPRRSQGLFVGISLAIVISVGLVDYASGWELSFSVFYLLALGLATWFVGRRFAFLIAILSVAVSLTGDLLVGGRYANHLVPWWNASILLAFYTVVVMLLANLRSLYEGLEAQVRQRTATLTQEIADRERLERELLEVSEREQRRIGHDLHDSLGQHLTGAALAGQVLGVKLALRGLPEAQDANKVVELVEEGIGLTRKLAKGLHPIEMEASGLMQALEELAATSSELLKVSCRFECDSPVLVREPSTSMHLYRIAQEAISNAVKHGRARNLTLQLEPLEEGVALRIKDDGSGLPDPLTGDLGPGMGMRIMKHRARMIGASFEARRDPPGGTLVTCILRYPESFGRVSHE